MKKTGLLNKDLSEVIAGMGHRDLLVIADAGLPIPSGVRRIDLAVRPGLPGFIDVLQAVLGELRVEEAVVASEMDERSPHVLARLRQALGEEVPINSTIHENFKLQTARARAVVRTGEFTPYANVILIAGVMF
ncbi:MAG: D-ribose pyranase [Anaerolineae bacterium CG2_30_64_16]|nr:MAG: D-ribose pyranase [Anaerolineae bacterium CG2_30_64_16]